MFKSQRKVLKGLIIPISIIFFLEIFIYAFDINNDAIAKPSEILKELINSLSDGSMVESTFHTIYCVLLGISISVILGVPIGLSIGLNQSLNRLLGSTIEILRPVPSIALMPLAMLLLGIGYRMETSVIIYTCVWPMIIMTAHAAEQIEKRHLEVASMLKLSLRKKIISIYLPSMLPRIMVAIRLTSAVALVVAITVEISGNPDGLGNLMINAQQSINPALMWGTLIWIAFIGWSINHILVKLNSWLFKPTITGAAV